MKIVRNPPIFANVYKTLLPDFQNKVCKWLELERFIKTLDFVFWFLAFYHKDKNFWFFFFN